MTARLPQRAARARPPVDELTEKYRELIAKARAGDVDAARRLLADIRHSAKSPSRSPGGEISYPIRRELMKYLAGCLTALLRGDPADRAFNLGHRRGRPKGAEVDAHQVAMAAAYTQ